MDDESALVTFNSCFEFFATGRTVLRLSARINKREPSQDSCDMGVYLKEQTIIHVYSLIVLSLDVIRMIDISPNIACHGDWTSAAAINDSIHLWIYESDVEALRLKAMRCAASYTHFSLWMLLFVVVFVWIENEQKQKNEITRNSWLFVVVIAERPGLVEARKVEKIQEIYLEALQAYVMNHRVRPMTEFAKLLSVLTELRTLGNLNSEMCFSLKLKNKKLPPFLAEIWDVHS